MGIDDQLRRLLPLIDEEDVFSLPTIFTNLTVHLVIHELVNVLLRVDLRRISHGGVH